MILDLWRGLRERQGDKAVDIKKRIMWNWPSISSDEAASVLDAYQRRMKMKRPSSPKNLPKHHIRCEYGPRKYTEVFESTNAAKRFLDVLLNNEPEPKWVTEDAFTSKGGELKVQCAELEDIWTYEGKKKWEMPDNMAQQLRAFLRGKWDNKSSVTVKAAAIKHKDTPPRGEVKHREINGMTTLASLCDKNGWEPRVVRAAMRKAGWDKPEAGWLWPTKEAAGVEKKIGGLL